MNPVTSPTSAPRWRRIVRLLLRTSAVLLSAILLAGLIALIVRDRVPVVGWLIYVPLVPLGAAGVMWDLMARGRGLPKLRFALGLVGAMALVFGVVTTLGAGLTPTAPAAAGATPLTLLQWNVRWGGGGGGRDGSSERWDSLCRDIAAHAPDMVVLSESPSDARVKELEQTLGPAWTSVSSRNGPRAPYLYSLVVASQWRVTIEGEAAIPSGRMMQATVAAPGGNVRVLVVDGESHFRHDRTVRLNAIARFCRDAAASDMPIDVIAGDFNAVGRSVGFDAIADAGFSSAGASAAGWRATWPSICPLYDIDHVWVSQRWNIASVERFANLVTDHRGQLARINVQ
jgi:endonuclease/exonuclease/phosphatase family metal-dependent hydrolase